MKILLPVDGSPFTQKTLNYLVDHPDIFSLQHHYVLLTVVPPLLPQIAGMLEKSVVNQYYKDASSATLDKAYSFLREKGYVISQGYKIGFVNEDLPQEADSGGYELVVMGTHGQSTFGNLMLGSVANAMLSRSKIPVLLIR